MRRWQAVFAWLVVFAATGCGGSSTSLTPTSDAAAPHSSAHLDAGPPDATESDVAQCPPGQLSCAGACTDTSTDEQNCGACGVACVGGQVCTAGKCSATCAAPQAKCDSDGGAYCANLQTDNANCGACGTTCAAGQVCSGGKCSATCGAPFEKCGQSCADTGNDPDNCGGCGKACGPYAHAAPACVQGECREICDSGYLDCSTGGTAGCTVDSRTDLWNCGACGLKCGPYPDAATACVGGACKLTCSAGHLDCDGVPYNGCEVDSSVDPSNCGACGHSCVNGCDGGVCRTVTALAAGAAHTCAALSDGSTWCWGKNGLGQVGDETFEERDSPVVLALTAPASLVAGGTHTCALLASGAVECWGYESEGLDSWSRYGPVPVKGLTDVVQLAAGDGHTCALLGDGTVECWGSNAEGQLGDGTTAWRIQPEPVPGLSGVAAIGAGGAHTCAVVQAGGLECWGENAHGEMGRGTASTPQTSPMPVPGISGVVAVTAGDWHTCAIVTGGTVYCWGDNSHGQLGDGTTTPHYVPAAIVAAGFNGVKSIAASGDHTCAEMPGGAVECWGRNSAVQIGDNGAPTDRLSPSAAFGVYGATAVATGNEYSCAALSDGAIDCWGAGENGQLGDGTPQVQGLPAPVTWP